MAFVENKSMAGYEPPKLIKGTYESEVKKAGISSNGSVMLTVEVQEGDFAGRQVMDFIQLDESKMTEDWMVERARNRQHQIEEALEVSFASGFDTDELIGKKFKAVFSPQKDRSSGEMKDGILKYIKG